MEYKFNDGQKQETKSAKNSNRKWSYNTILGLVAYVAIGCIAIAMLIALVVKGNSTVSNVFRAIGESIAYIICIVLAFSWVKTHKQIPWIVCYVVFVVTIIVLYILTIQF